MLYSKSLASIIDNSNGKMLAVTFIKKDGTERVLNGRIGVTKYIKGVGTKNKSDEFISIYDVQAKGYRSVNRSTIVAVRSAGIEAFAVR
jgi:hypothetical protein